MQGGRRCGFGVAILAVVVGLGGGAAHAGPAAVGLADGFNAGVAFDRAAAQVPAGSSAVVTLTYAVAGDPPPGAELGFHVTYAQGLAVEAPGGQCAAAGTRTLHCVSPPEGTGPQLRATVAAGTAVGTTLAISAAVDELAGDTVAADDAATAVVTVAPLEAQVSVTAPATTVSGEVFTVVVRLTNDSDEAVSEDVHGAAETRKPGVPGDPELYRWISMPADCGADPGSYFCGDGGTVPAHSSRDYRFRVTTVPQAAGYVFSLSAQWTPTPTVSLRDSASVQVLAPAQEPTPDPAANPSADPVADRAAVGADPASRPTLAATGGGEGRLAVLALVLLGSGAMVLRLRRRA